MLPRPRTSPLFPYTTLFRSRGRGGGRQGGEARRVVAGGGDPTEGGGHRRRGQGPFVRPGRSLTRPARPADRKSTRLNSSHMSISYAVFCLKNKKNSPCRTAD